MKFWIIYFFDEYEQPYKGIISIKHTQNNSVGPKDLGAPAHFE